MSQTEILEMSVHDLPGNQEQQTVLARHIMAMLANDTKTADRSDLHREFPNNLPTAS